MKMEKTREALVDYGLVDGAERDALDAIHEVEQAESLLREAAALKSFAVAGLSAFHGTFCSDTNEPTTRTASECVDPKCRAWAKAVQGDLDATLKELTTLKDGEYDEAKRDARNAALEEAAALFDAEVRAYEGKHHATVAAQNAQRIRALKRGG